ncbi:MAG: AAA domain-containing protein [Dysgonomonas sp.]|nr:AAA domain-containing protein [Dysgonomonas sp.]
MHHIDKLKYNEIISEITENDRSGISLKEKYIRLKRILERSCKDITAGESLQFPSLFSRLVFIAQKYQLPRTVEWNLQNLRVRASFLLRNEKNIISESQYKRALSAVNTFISIIYDDNVLVTENIEIEKEQLTDDKGYLRLQVIDIDRDKEIIVGEADSEEDSFIYVRYNVKNINDAFNKTVERLWGGAQLNIIDYKVDEEGHYEPRFMVVEPDYLIDTSAIAECFQNYGRSHLHYFRRKFEQTPNSQYILLGNLANFFLDELVFSANPEALEFGDVFVDSFRQKPFEFTSCNDIKKPEDFRAFMVKARTQFDNIKRVITHDFTHSEIDIDRCTLEPSFFCEKFGFQGRLDLLQLSDSKSELHRIVELKSGGLPYPKNDPTRIAINHEVQTTIYRLIIQSVFDVDARKIWSSILYSAAENTGENLRVAVNYQTLEKEIVNLRNLIVATEHDLYRGGEMVVERLFRDIFNLDNYGKVPDFFSSQINALEKVLRNISEVERLYFYRYISFIARELYIQKSGDDYLESARSTASLWNTEFRERMESFDLVSDLEIIDIEETERDMKITFQRNDEADFVNFREGEICILYPREKESDTALTNQILKGTIAEIMPQNVILRFRYKQRNKDFFRKYTRWAIEHDRLDHTYNNMYKSLFSFLTSDINKRELLLGVRPPYSTLYDVDNECNGIVLKQNSVIEKAIAAEDYFLIVGPPGTGKTSVFARHLIEHYYHNTQDNILIIAYTNRAVDELCEAINQAFGCCNQECGNYIRIGTELSCSEGYRHRLLQNIASQVKSREELRNIISRQRIFIGTLAAIVGKPEIFDIKQFHISIIDEASQILEPQIIGLLPQVGKFIMIGDHKQLSTITLQDEQKSEVTEPELNAIELYNCRESLFERLFRICLKNGWNQAYDTLTYQGRMHEELASFPNKHFYEGMLQPISEWQSEPLKRETRYDGSFHQIILGYRLAFFDCPGINDAISDKVNYSEADTIVLLCKAILDVYRENNLFFDKQKSLGIITPYRNQIALIRHKLHETGIEELQGLMIDTVERFQGSQKDIILLSFCMNKPYQLSFFMNLNKDKTVDRKLNVALTRARQQMFLVGNRYILSQNKIYRELLDSMVCLNSSNT